MFKGKVYEYLYRNRFEIFLASLLSILFGSLFFPEDLHIRIVAPILLMFNMLAGILLISKQKLLSQIFLALLFSSIFIFGSNPLVNPDFLNDVKFFELAINFIFYSIVTYQIIRHIWSVKEVNKNVIMGLMCGYISLGLLAFMLFFAIELAYPGSFQGFNMLTDSPKTVADSLLYYSFVTLLTIGYGEIFPISPIAQKVAILIGLAGQFYLVIITAVVVEKYIRYLGISASS
ncbi:MAG: potassium channel family protein [Bacteroidota bacterium]